MLLNLKCAIQPCNIKNYCAKKQIKNDLNSVCIYVGTLEQVEGGYFVIADLFGNLVRMTGWFWPHAK